VPKERGDTWQHSLDIDERQDAVFARDSRGLGRRSDVFAVHVKRARCGPDVGLDVARSNRQRGIAIPEDRAVARPAVDQNDRRARPRLDGLRRGDIDAFASQALEPEPAELIEVQPTGTVLSWSWAPAPLAGQPLEHPFAWALIRLDGADTAMLHAVDAGSAAAMRTGMAVRARWAAERTGHIRDIACFEPGDEPGPVPGPAAGQEPVTMMTTPVQLSYEHTASPAETAYLHGLAQGRLLGQRCPVCGKVYLPPRGACPTCGVPTADEVELPGTGTVTTFCVVVELLRICEILPSNRSSG